jgi:putative endonuclease
MPYFAYILECVDGTYYIGSTDNLYARVALHNEGRGASYTRSRLPARLVYHEEFSDRGQAMKRERELKKLNKQQKKKLVEKAR